MQSLSKFKKLSGRVFQSHFGIPSNIEPSKFTKSSYQLPIAIYLGLLVSNYRFKCINVFASNHVSQQQHLQIAISSIHLPLVDLVPPPIIPHPMYTLLGDILVLTMLQCYDSFPYFNHKVTTSQTMLSSLLQIILSTFPFCQPLISITLSTNNQQKQTILLLIFMPHNHFQNRLRCCGESPLLLQKTFVIGSFHDLAPNIFLPIFTEY